MRWAVIGSNSFSGKAFCSYLELEQNEDVFRVERPAFDLNRGQEDLRMLLNRIEPHYIVNFAALSMVAQSWQRPLDWFRTNVMGMIELTDWLRQQKWLHRFVQISTPEVYGSTGAALGEGAPYNPTTPYAVSRASCDMWLATLHRAYGFPVLFTRTVNVYGPGQQLYRIIPKTIMCILPGQNHKLDGGGVSTRSFIHIDDVCCATYLTAMEGRAGMCYHSSTDRQISIRDLVALICNKMGAHYHDVVEESPERLGKDMNYQLDSTLIRRELGWSDAVKLEDGIDEVIKWVTENYATLKTQSQVYEHRP